MPVWHELTREWREAGELVLVGIATEQHPQRCRLFAQWQGFDWPILWDPFNLTGSKVVPGVVAVDEHGIVRSVRPDPRTIEEEFLLVDFPAPDGAEAAAFGGACGYGDAHDEPTPWSTLMTAGGLSREEWDETLEWAEGLAADNPDDAALAFRAGVARRMRYDSPFHRADDFQAAVDGWTQALARDPNQYIWRRRIQQYGPRMDKPYPFYDWVDGARREVAARGEQPIDLRTALTPAELAQPLRKNATPASFKELDAKGEIRRDDGLIALESAVAFDTRAAGLIASVHLTLRPNALRQAHWNHEAGPTVQLWVAASEGATIDPVQVEVTPRSDVATSDELQQLSFEVTMPEGMQELELEGYALYYVCEGAEGTCLYLRQDVSVSVRRPR